MVKLPELRVTSPERDTVVIEKLQVVPAFIVSRPLGVPIALFAVPAKLTVKTC